MSQKWSGSRFASRQSGSNVKLSSRAPAFHPPSYYAAAAGLSPRLGTTSNLGGTVEDSTDYQSMQGVPISYPTAGMGADEPEGSHESHRRKRTLSRSFTRSGPRHHKEQDLRSIEDNRRQMADIPFLETQLLPSLRDTIDKMTHPPRHAGQDEESFRSYKRDNERYMEDSETLTVSQNKPAGRSPVVKSGYTPTLAVTPRLHSHSTPETPALDAAPTSLLNASSPAGTDKGPISKTTSKIPGSSRMPTKSALRPDPPMSSSIPNTPVLSPRPQNTAEKSLRSAKSIAAVPQSPGASLAGYMRSPTVPYTGSSKLPQSTGSRSRSQTVTSRVTDRSQATVNPPLDSGSELEREYGKRLVASRLVIANAEVVPSSSESEHDGTRRGRSMVEDDRSRSKTRIPKAPKDFGSYVSPRIQQRSPAISPLSRPEKSHEIRRARNVGLGLQGYAETDHAYTRNINGDGDPGNCDSEDQQNAYFVPNSPRRLSQHAQRNPYERPGLDLRDRGGPSGASNALTESSSGKRRREALIGLVNGLELDVPLSIRQQEKKSGGRNGDRRECYVQRTGTPGSLPDESDLENYEEPTAISDGRRCGRVGNDLDRVRTAAQSSRLLMSSQAKPRGPNYVERHNSRDRRRQSMSLPPKDNPASDFEDRNQKKATRRDDDDLPDDEDITDVRHRKSRHRASTSASQITSKRRSGVDALGDSKSVQRPRLDRRSSSQATETTGTRNRRKSDTVARERAAFGIPDSLSYSGYDVPEPSVNFPPQTLHQNHVDDCVVSEDDPQTLITCATPEGERWEQQDSGGFSSAAQALFNQLSNGPEKRASEDRAKSKGSSRRRSSSMRTTVVHDRTWPSHHLPETRKPEHDGTISASSSAPSMYDVEPEDQDHSKTVLLEFTPRPDEATGSWRSTLPHSTYDTLLSTYGEAEMQRQELIFQLCKNHSAFVRRLGSIVKVFVVPLRRKDSKVWLAGVPKEVSNLFDWLEDILNLHRSLDNTLRLATEAWRSGDITRNIAQVLRAFVPRLEIYQPYLVRVDDVQHILAESTSAGDEFGQFIMLRQTYQECGNQSLEELLMLPVHHLYSTVQIYKELWQASLATHRDHLASLSLYQSMRMIVHVLHEVKTREEEYNYVKDMSSNIEDLLPSVQLAQRERRLLWHGEMLHVSAKPDTTSKRNSQGRRQTTLSPPLGGRSGSYRTPAIVFSPPASNQNDHERNSSSNLGKAGAQSSTLDITIFTDIVLLTERTVKNGRSSQRLSAEAGVSKVLAVHTMGSYGSTEATRSVVLSLLPLSQSDLQSGAMPTNASIVEVKLAFPPGQEGSKEFEDTVLSAFHRCRAYTLSSLSFPSHSGQYLPHGSQVDLELDTQRSVMDILNTGLPLPKSPSVQLQVNQRLDSKESNDTDREREERGWWTLRFQQILREMQRQDPRLSLAMFEDE